MKTMRKSKKSTPMPNSIVLGIDPGFGRVGFAVLKDGKILFSHCLETNPKLSHQNRLSEVGEMVREIIEKWRPTSLSIEKLFFNQNTNNALKISEARGVIVYEANRMGLDIYEYSPQEVKIAVTGYGKADKTQVENMVKKLVKIPKKSGKILDDEIDAIALGITCLASKKSI